MNHHATDSAIYSQNLWLFGLKIEKVLRYITTVKTIVLFLVFIAIFFRPVSAAHYIFYLYIQQSFVKLRDIVQYTIFYKF